MIFNYANPMAMMTWAANTYGGVQTIGLCHGVQNGHKLMAEALALPQEEIDIIFPDRRGDSRGRDVHPP